MAVAGVARASESVTRRRQLSTQGSSTVVVRPEENSSTTTAFQSAAVRWGHHVVCQIEVDLVDRPFSDLKRSCVSLTNI